MSQSSYESLRYQRYELGSTEGVLLVVVLSLREGGAAGAAA
jgi:hypothetical protein